MLYGMHWAIRYMICLSYLVGICISIYVAKEDGKRERVVLSSL